MAVAERTYPTEVIAKALLLTPRRVRQLTAEGVFTRARDPETGEFLRGRYELFPTLHSYIRFLREGRLEDPDESNYVRARTRRMITEARLAELRYQTAIGKLHRAEDVEFVFTQIFTGIRAKLLAIPSRTARLLIGKTDFGEIVSVLQAEVEFALTELVAVDRSMFQSANEQYLASLLPEPIPANGNGQQGREDADADDERFDSD
jgi:phage terminase Nu1 subunit (DNA packaging protein)